MSSHAQEHLANFLTNTQAQHIVLGYGSLLSRDSRERYSDIFTQGIPVQVAGFQRAWVTRSIGEKQTYVGAIADSNSQLNAQLIPTNINPKLKDREKDYRFVEVEAQALSFAQVPMNEQLVRKLDSHTFWLCETLAILPANEQFPVSQSYVDTCLSGCLEHGGDAQARAFVEHTKLWSHPRINDRHATKYPRAAKVDALTQGKIDGILKAQR